MCYITYYVLILIYIRRRVKLPLAISLLILSYFIPIAATPIQDSSPNVTTWRFFDEYVRATLLETGYSISWYSFVFWSSITSVISYFIIYRYIVDYFIIYRYWASPLFLFSSENSWYYLCFSLLLYRRWTTANKHLSRRLQTNNIYFSFIIQLISSKRTFSLG